MGQKSISQLDTISQAHDTDLFEVAAVDSQSASGYKSGKMSAEVIAEGLLSTYTYPTAMPNMQNKTITGALNQLLANFAPTYDDTETYSVGDVRTYNGQLYKCETAVSTAETFDPTKWAAIVVTELSGGQNYSTSEQVIGTWIDGKPLYQKTFTGSFSVTTTGRAWYSIYSVNDLASLHIDKCMFINGLYKEPTQSFYIDMGVMKGNDGLYCSMLYNPSEGIKFVVCNGATGTGEFIFTIQYTKTTD